MREQVMYKNTKHEIRVACLNVGMYTETKRMALALEQKNGSILPITMDVSLPAYYHVYVNVTKYPFAISVINANNVGVFTGRTYVHPVTGDVGFEVECNPYILEQLDDEGLWDYENELQIERQEVWFDNRLQITSYDIHQLFVFANQFRTFMERDVVEESDCKRLAGLFDKYYALFDTSYCKNWQDGCAENMAYSDFYDGVSVKLVPQEARLMNIRSFIRRVEEKQLGLLKVTDMLCVQCLESYMDNVKALILSDSEVAYVLKTWCENNTIYRCTADAVENEDTNATLIHEVYAVVCTK